MAYAEIWGGGGGVVSVILSLDVDLVQLDCLSFLSSGERNG